jgi:hypothetical protein
VGMTGVPNLDGSSRPIAFDKKAVAVLRVERPATGQCIDILGGGEGQQLPGRKTRRITHLPNEVIARFDGNHAEKVVVETWKSDPLLTGTERVAIASSPAFCGTIGRNAKDCRSYLVAERAILVDERSAVWVR